MKPEARQSAAGGNSAAGRALSPVAGRHAFMAGTLVGLQAVLVALVPTIDLNDEWVKYFDHDVPFRVDAEFAMDNLNGIYLVEYSMDSGEAGGISDPDALLWEIAADGRLHCTMFLERLITVPGIPARRAT